MAFLNVIPVSCNRLRRIIISIRRQKCWISGREAVYTPKKWDMNSKLPCSGFLFDNCIWSEVNCIFFLVILFRFYFFCRTTYWVGRRKQVSSSQRDLQAYHRRMEIGGMFPLLEWRSHSSMVHIPWTIWKLTVLLSEARRANNTFSIAGPYYLCSGYIPFLRCSSL